LVALFHCDAAPIRLFDKQRGWRDGRLAPVARDDLAEVAAAVLTVDGAHDGQTYDVTGHPESYQHLPPS
jgi:uncharacterized protein YbjT (DUF2867 family)